MQRVPIAGAILLASLVPVRIEAVNVGSPAPAVEPTEWLNAKKSVSWKGLKGRLVLVEKWATW